MNIGTSLKWIAAGKYLAGGVKARQINSRLWPYGSMEPHWANLLEWLKLHHARVVAWTHHTPARFVDEEWMTQERMVFASLFTTVEDLRDLPWARVEKMVENQRPLFVMCARRWSK